MLSLVAANLFIQHLGVTSRPQLAELSGRQFHEKLASGR